MTRRKPSEPVLDADTKKPFEAAFSSKESFVPTPGMIDTSGAGLIGADTKWHALHEGAVVNVGDYVVKVVRTPDETRRSKSVKERLFEKLAILPALFVEQGSRPGKSGTPEPSAEVEDYLIRSAVNMELSIIAVGAALESVETPVSPQLARSLQATENAWRGIEKEFGLLSATEISRAVGSKSPNRSYASEQHAAGKLLAVKRGGAYRYPGFQLDRVEHRIRPVMADLLRVAKEAGRSEASLALWMVMPTGYLDGARPVDQLVERPERAVEVAQASFGVQW